MADAQEDRSFAPTERRLQQARAEGRVALSREAVSLASLACGVAVSLGLGDAAAQAAMAVMRAGLQGDLPSHGAGIAARMLLLAVLPVGGGALAAAIAASLLQTGVIVTPARLLPDLSRISPGAGLARLASGQTLWAALRALVQTALLAAGLAVALRGPLRAGIGLMQAQLPALWASVQQAMRHLALVSLGLAAIIAGLDVAVTRLRHMRQLRMSREELREELRQSEGAPELRQRRRQIALARARRRMMAAVPKAAVIITNPEHYAVALAYHRGSRRAPRVCAKGADALALRIREVARAAHVPIIANPPLARALYRVELETEIPPEHFRAVAEIIAYIWRLDQRQAIR